MSQAKDETGATSRRLEEVLVCSRKNQEVVGLETVGEGGLWWF